MFSVGLSSVGKCKGQQEMEAKGHVDIYVWFGAMHFAPGVIIFLIGKVFRAMFTGP